jgi:tol-pal system protein YbgF
MTMKFFFTIPLLVVLTACVPQAMLEKNRAELTDTREDIRATKAQVQDLQKRLDALDTNARGTGDMRQALADYGAKADQLATDIQLLQGKLEENNYHIADLAQKLDDKSFKITELSAKIDELDAKVKLLSGGTTTTLSRQTGSVLKSPEPSEVYKQAKSDYDKGSMDLALAGFQNYLSQFPTTSQAGSAQYWIGECYYAKKDFGKAIEAFVKVVKSYPKSEKTAGAKLKIGYSYLNERNTIKAKEYLHQVIKEYPHSEEAQLAKAKLKKLSQYGSHGTRGEAVREIVRRLCGGDRREFNSPGFYFCAPSIHPPVRTHFLPHPLRLTVNFT